MKILRQRGFTAISSFLLLLIIFNVAGGSLEVSRVPVPSGEKLTSCKAMNPASMSKDICGELCNPGGQCEETGACLCQKEPGASMLGGHFTHCTNWSYVDQQECTDICTKAGTNDHRVCWTAAIGNYCVCFNK